MAEDASVALDHRGYESVASSVVSLDESWVSGIVAKSVTCRRHSHR